MLLGCIFLVIKSNVGEAYFPDLGAGVRPLGMGGAYVAVADDANAPLWNAAGISQLRRGEIASMYSLLYADLDAQLYTGEADTLAHHFVSYVTPLGKRNAVGLSWMTFDTEIYDENTFVLTYAKKVSKKISLGLNLKMLNWKVEGTPYTRADPLIKDGTSCTGFTTDLGIHYKRNGRFSLGFSAENLVPVDMGIEEEEIIPLNLRAGGAYKLGKFAMMGETLLATDVTYRNREVNNKKDVNIHLGIESWFPGNLPAQAGKFGLRIGGNLDEACAGLGWKFVLGEIELQLDYAYVYPFEIEETGGTHRFATIIGFGPSGKPVYEKKITKEISEGHILMVNGRQEIFNSFPKEVKVEVGSILGVYEGKNIVGGLEVVDVFNYEAVPEKIVIKTKRVLGESKEEIKKDAKVKVISEGITEKEEERIEQWSWELIFAELAKQDSAVMQELYNCFSRGQIVEKGGKLEEAKELYEKIAWKGREIYQKAKGKIRKRVALEKKLKGYDKLAKLYYEQGKLLEARELWQTILSADRQE